MANIGEIERVDPTPTLAELKRRGINDCEVSRATGIDRTRLVAWRTGRRRPTLYEIDRIAVWLGDLNLVLRHYEQEST